MSDNKIYNIISGKGTNPWQEQEKGESHEGVTKMSDRTFYYDDMTAVVREAFEEFFGSAVEFLERKTEYGQNGRFWLKFRLIPKDILITFLSEKDMIQILLEDPEGAVTSLAGMAVYGNELSEENIITAVRLLKRILDEYEPVFAKDHGKNVMLKKNGAKSLVSAGEYRRMMTAHECKIPISQQRIRLIRQA